MKKCTKCKETKLEEEFYKNRTHKSGLTFWCKVCTNYQNNFIQKETKAIWAARAYRNLKKKNHPKLLWKGALHRAKENELDFDISVEDVVIPEKCPYLNINLDCSDKNHLPSIDRINSSKGYTKGNIRIISLKANRMKSDSSIEELIAFARGILLIHAKEGIDCAAKG